MAAQISQFSKCIQGKMIKSFSEQNGGSRAPATSSCVTLSRTGLAGLRARRPAMSGRVNSFAAGPVPPEAWGHDGAIRCQPGRHHPGG